MMKKPIYATPFTSCITIKLEDSLMAASKDASQTGGGSVGRQGGSGTDYYDGSGIIDGNPFDTDWD